MSRVRGWTAAVLAGLAALVLTVQPAVAQEGPLVFVGSSIFHRWTNLAAQMAPLPVVNRAVDGLMTSDVLAMLDRAVLPLHPRVVVYYCGSNDVDAGEPADAIVARIRRQVCLAQRANPVPGLPYAELSRRQSLHELRSNAWQDMPGVQSYESAGFRELPAVRHSGRRVAECRATGLPRAAQLGPWLASPRRSAPGFASRRG